MSTAADMSARLTALRAQLQRDGLDGFVIPLTDEHMSEYVGAYAQRLTWLTGFGGSAGWAVVLRDTAAIFVDGRYTLQVRDQVDAAHWRYETRGAGSVTTWLGEHVGSGQRIGYDPWLHTREWVAQASEALTRKGAELSAIDANPVDTVWHDRPAPGIAPAFPHDEAFAGRSASEKVADIAAWLTARRANTLVLTALDSVAWTLNIRGSDVSHTPVALAYAVVHADARVELFITPEKADAALRAHMGAAVTVRPRADFARALEMEFTGKTVAVDLERAVVAIFAALEAGGATIDAVRDPVVLAKALKSPAEIAGHKAAQLRDGAALTRFLRWISVEGPKGSETELSAAARLHDFRRDTNQLIDLSFDTISGAGPNGAVVHYRVDESTNRTIAPDMLYLVDSGGQYRDGTTDATRTLAIGQPGADMRRHFTLVLKGHIAIATAIFPKGTRGNQLDILARHALWQHGLDYAHGTGHGVGSFLSVHEGPQRIATFGGGDEPLQPGMIVSNEPGYYKPGAYGIRIENLVLVVEKDIAGAEKPMLGFETLTFAPIDRALIDISLLNDQERDWLNGYHTEVRSRIGPQLDAETAAWLDAACAPL